MWDRPDFPSHLTERAQLHDEASFLWWQTQQRNRFEFMRYLPLFRGQEPAKGLTFYYSDIGIIGIAAHFATMTIFAGYRDGLPMYIPFEEGESLKVLYYRCLGILYEDCPSFVVSPTTSLAAFFLANHHISNTPV